MWRKLIYPLIALLLASLYFLTEDVRTVEQSWSRGENLKAAYTFLEQRSVSSERVYGSARLFPPASTLLIMDSNRGRLNAEHIEALREWVFAGGRLILEARPMFYSDVDDSGDDDDFRFEDDAVNYAIDGYDTNDLEENDPLLYSFGVSAWEVPREHTWETPWSYLGVPQWNQDTQASKCLNPADEEKDRCRQMLCGDVTHTPTYSLGYVADAPRQIAFAPELKLMHIDQFDEQETEQPDPTTPVTDTRINLTFGNEYGDQLLHLHYGEGDVIALTNLDIWYNRELDWLDHAWLLAELTDGHTAAWWVHSVDVPPLLAWLWLHAWPLLCSLLLLLLFFLWMRMPRVGVMIPQWQHNPRDFLHHLRASASFLWRHQQNTALLSPLREQIRLQLRAHQGTDSLDALCAMASVSGMTDEAVRYAMSHSPSDEQELTQMISLLQQLRSRI